MNGLLGERSYLPGMVGALLRPLGNLRDIEL